MAVSLIRTIILYILLTIAVRIMGKRQIGELQNSELVITLLISNLAAIPMQDSSIPLTSGLIPIFILVTCEVIVSYGMLGSKKFRDLICGHSIPIIKNGKIMQENMKKIRFTSEDLCESLRLKDVFNVDNVEYAAVETNGKISVYLKPAQSPVTKSDINIKDNTDDVYIAVVAQGKICMHSLIIIEKSVTWVNDILKKEKCTPKDIYIMNGNRSGEYMIIKRKEVD